MACVAVTSLMRTLDLEFLQSNPRLILQDKQHIMSLYEKLGCLQTFIDESEKKADNCEELKDVIAKIREVVSKAEYDIDAELVEIQNQTPEPETACWQCQPLIQIFCQNLLTLRPLRRILQEIEELIEMIENAPHLAKDVQSQHPESLSFGGQSPTQRASNFGDTIIIGQAKELEDFKAQLLQSSNEPLQVMALVGMGGIGKTTFARRLYDDSAVKSYFDCCGWATMSQEHNKKKAFLELCRLMCEDINTENIVEPAEQLRKSLLGRRYLIVLDDIWTTEAWDDVKRCFPEEDENTGSCILLTTRQKEVADYACSSKLSHDMRFLDSDESWNLFYQKLLVKDDLNEEFETIGRNIVQKCHGLPLTVVVLAGILSTNMAIDEWENVESMLDSLVNLELSKQFSRILTLSYNNLPCHLKSCFLYLGTFPEDFEIETKKVIRLWIAEGFIKEVSEKTVEELGEVYLHELINRSLIMISGRSSDGKIKTCRIHDILHDLCVRKAKNEKLLFALGIDDTELYMDGCRWLTVEHSPELLYYDHWCECRSILYFERVTFDYRLIHIGSFKMLRVLDMMSVSSLDASVPNYSIDVLLLRYLALPSNWLLTSIPVRKNKNLQTLVVCEDFNNAKEELSHGIWELTQLRHLQFHHQLSIYDPKMVQLNLQTMYWLHSFQCTKKVFYMIPNVKELGIIIPQGCLDNLKCLNMLEKLKVEGSYCPIQLPTCSYCFPQNLNNITLSKTLIPWKDMSIISMLPSLEVLKLKNHACQGQEWELSEEDGFCRLKHLLISVTDLEDWKANDVIGNPFPVLEHLVLRYCFKLKEMPSWIDRIQMLKSIQLEHCYASLVHSARMIEEEQRECYGEEYGFQILEFHSQSDVSVWVDARSLYFATVENPEDLIWNWDFRHEVVQLLYASWIDIIGTIDTKCLRRMTSYSAYLVFKLKFRALGQITAVASVIYLKDKDKKSNSDENQGCQVFLAINSDDDSRSPGDSGRFPSTLFDGWMEIKLGEFYVNSGNEGEVEMRLWNSYYDSIWRHGLIVKGIEVRPN